MSTASDLGLGRQLGLDSCSWPPPLMGLQGSPCSRLTSSLLRRLLLPTQPLSLPGRVHPWVQMWVGFCRELRWRDLEHTLCPAHQALWSPPGQLAQLSFPEPPRSWLPRQADSRRMVLLRLPRAQAASFPPSPSPGTGWAGLQRWELRRLLLFFSFFFETSLRDSMKCPLLPTAWLGRADLVGQRALDLESRVRSAFCLGRPV